MRLLTQKDKRKTTMNKNRHKKHPKDLPGDDELEAMEDWTERVLSTPKSLKRCGKRLIRWEGRLWKE